MQVSVCFYSYFKEFAGCANKTEELPDKSTIADLLKKVFVQIPKLANMEKSMLVAVGVDYQPRDYVLKNGDEVSLFPPVQGG
ncbi:MAG: sulfur-carrier protein [Verrucomicrobiota bacterium]|jgi:molybdopterin converting factor small subunit